MRAITIRQPWAHLVVCGVKDVENRSTNVFGAYRGPLVIHSSRQVDRQALASARVRDALRSLGLVPGALPALPLGAALAVVELVDVHHDSVHVPVVVDDVLRVTDPCSPWAQRDAWHAVLADVRPLAAPVPWTGHLGLWDLPDAALVFADALASGDPPCNHGGSYGIEGGARRCLQCPSSAADTLPMGVAR